MVPQKNKQTVLKNLLNSQKFTEEKKVSGVTRKNNSCTATEKGRTTEETRDRYA